MRTITPTSHQVMQRVKVGLIGLSAVILLIGLASAVFSTANRERPVDTVGGSRADMVANLTITNTAIPSDPAKEPLAELGVGPGGVESNASDAGGGR